MDMQTTIKQDTLQSFISDGTPEDVRERYASLPALAAKADYGDLDRNIVIIDLETTGLSFNQDELTQISAARMECGEIVAWFNTFVNPGKPIPEEVSRLTRIYEKDVADAPSPTDAIADLVEFVGDAKIVAHNSEFDRTFSTRHPSGYPLLENAWIDSLDLARIALPRLTSHRLLDLARAFNVLLPTHRANDDVAATCAVFRILLAAVSAMPPLVVCTIANLATPEEWPTQKVFSHFAENVSRETSRAADSRAADVSTARFSMRDLRRKRLGEHEYAARIDADKIAADPQRELKFPTSEVIADAFSKTGLVGALYHDFEQRDEQVVMAEAVRDVFETSKNLMVEAGTGVGKSMAYLVPLALTAQANKITVGVATKTNTLLDQLVYHELPALAASLHEQDPTKAPLSSVSLKGYSHYLCLRRVERMIKNGSQMLVINGKEQSSAPALATLLAFIEQTEYDDFDGLKIDYRVLPRRAVSTTSHDCLRRKCPYYHNSCFVHGARREAASADIVVTNHSLLFRDLMADRALLPPVRYWVIDEAHGTESEARRAFSLSLAAEDLLRIASRVDDAQATHNVFARAQRRVAAVGGVLEQDEDVVMAKTTESKSSTDIGSSIGLNTGSNAGSNTGSTTSGSPEGATLFFALNSKARSAGTTFADAAREFTNHMKDLLYFDQNKKGRGYETVDLWINSEIRESEKFTQLVSLGHVMVDAAEKLITASQELVAYMDDIKNVVEEQNEIASVAMDLKDQVQAARTILFDAPKTYAYAATLSRKKDRIAEKLEALLFDVGEAMGEKLYETTHSVVFTSATLTVDNKFDVFENALGLNKDEYSNCELLRLDSSYDFDKQMTIYVVEDMPEPNESAYLPALQRLLVALHRAQQGSMLTLFTNRREMEKCFEEVQQQLKDDDLRIVCQKWGVSTKGLRDDFLKDEHLSLFALKSFWEGFDAPGATLRGVIIPKLPFTKPTDPLSCERNERIDHAWSKYDLPAAVLETKQAAGRLIRKASDTGVIILADHRLISKYERYGKTFLRSMPSHTVKQLPMVDIAAEIEHR